MRTRVRVARAVRRAPGAALRHCACGRVGDALARAGCSRLDRHSAAADAVGVDRRTGLPPRGPRRDGTPRAASRSLLAGLPSPGSFIETVNVYEALLDMRSRRSTLSATRSPAARAILAAAWRSTFHPTPRAARPQPGGLELARATATSHRLRCSWRCISRSGYLTTSTSARAWRHISISTTGA